MKQTAVILVMCLLLFQLTACSEPDKSAEYNISNNQGNSQAGSSIPETAVKVQASEPIEDPGTFAQTPASTQTALPATKTPAQTDSNSVVIAKSSNVISNKDKEAILKEIDKELDDLLTNINSIEDLKDSDLELN